jgi:hypothetical protein
MRIREWRKGIEMGEGDVLVEMVSFGHGGLVLRVVDKDGRPVLCGNLLVIEGEGYVRLIASVNPELGFKLVGDGFVLATHGMCV